jgi:hypothetical protein
VRTSEQVLWRGPCLLELLDNPLGDEVNRGKIYLGSLIQGTRGIHAKERDI